jgi:hypothetical protein
MNFIKTKWIPLLTIALFGAFTSCSSEKENLNPDETVIKEAFKEGTVEMGMFSGEIDFGKFIDQLDFTSK